MERGVDAKFRVRRASDLFFGGEATTQKREVTAAMSVCDHQNKAQSAQISQNTKYGSMLDNRSRVLI